jgi:hypothetical protein
MNIHRHSGSKSATVRLFRRADSVTLEIRDQDEGIPIEKLNAIHAPCSGIGITGMRERVRDFNGAMEIHSNDTGTKITVILPVSTTDSAESENAPPSGPARSIGRSIKLVLASASPRDSGSPASIQRSEINCKT